MNIVFLTRYDPNNLNIWSGTLLHVNSKLKEKHNIVIIGSEIFKQFRVFSIDNIANEIVFPSKHLNVINKLLSERINNLDFDLVFFGDLFFTPLEIEIPLVHFTDLTYEQTKNYYFKTDEILNDSCLKYEKNLLDSSFKIIYCSNWIKELAIKIYDVDSSKIEVVELGANIPSPNNYCINNYTDICKLLFIGKDWERKGGDMMLEIYEILKNDNFPCSLTIIGSGNKEIDINDSHFTVYPFLDKTNPTDLEKLCNILSESHFLVLPTKFDAFGIVFCEASAYGVPSISADVGGVSQAIKEGKNGYLLPSDATVTDYAEKIKDVFSDKDHYIKLRQSSRKEYETRLNWDIWGEKVNKILDDAVREFQKLRTFNHEL